MLIALREDTLRVRREEKEEREDLMAMGLHREVCVTISLSTDTICLYVIIVPRVKVWASPE